MGNWEDATLVARRKIGACTLQSIRLESDIFFVERLGEAGKFGAGGDQRHQAKRAVRVRQPGNRRYLSGKMTRAGHKLDRALVELAEGRSIGCGEARNV
jgi:hypothetical protein